MSSFEADSTFELVSIIVPIRGRQVDKQGYTKLINVKSHKFVYEDFYNEYIKPESEIESFHFFDDRIHIILKNEIKQTRMSD